MYERAISDQDFSFWYINLVAKRKEDMFHVRFEHKMVIGAVDEEDDEILGGIEKEDDIFRG
ncbi:MAG: hypothetical protein GY700_01505 [Propionibacteriaceae bacterium]|nr:hypothetical protein [Propionibacteriaceae bacterium]